MITMMDFDFKNVTVFNCRIVEIKSLEGGDDRPPPVI